MSIYNYPGQSAWLNRLALKTGMEGLEFDENGCCVLKIDDELLLSIVVDSVDGLIISLSKNCETLSTAALISVLERNRIQYLSSLPIFTVSIIDETVTYLELLKVVSDCTETIIEEMIEMIDSVHV